MKKLMILAAACGVLAALPAAAQFQKPEDAIKYRQSAFTVMNNHVARIGAMVQGRTPFDAKAAADSAHIVAVMSTLPFSAFGDGTDKGMPHRAKPEIWKDGAKFKAAADKMAAEAAKLETAAKSGSLDAIKAVFGGVGGSCKACHDDFRAERYSN
ncbi:MAG: cytochrome c [Betaproteobacteria bacterium]